MKSKPLYHVTVTKNLGIIRILKYTMIWKNLAKAAEDSAEKMGVPHLRLGKYSIRLTRGL